MKKGLALILTMALMFSMMSAVSAQEAVTTEQKAQTLYELDLFLGTNPETFTPNLAGQTNRAQAMVMIGRALKWDSSEFWDTEATSGFLDVDDWAEPYVARAVQEGITVGVGGNRFGADQSVTHRQLQTWSDRALGMADTWEANEALDNDLALIREDLVDSIWTLLQKPLSGEETSLISTIIGENEVQLRTAIRAGLMPADVTVILVVAGEIDGELDFVEFPVHMTTEEAASGYLPLLELLEEETGLIVNGVTIDGKDATVDLHGDMQYFINQGSAGAHIRTQTLIRTFLNLPDTDRVRFTIDGVEDVEMDHYSFIGWFESN